MWHASSRSGVATLRTAIHLLLTYLLTEDRARAHHKAIISLFPGVRRQTLTKMLTTKSSGRPQKLQLCRQRVPCSRCGDRESRVADSSTCPRHDEVTRRQSTQCRSSGYIGNTDVSTVRHIDRRVSKKRLVNHQAQLDIHEVLQKTYQMSFKQKCEIKETTS